MIGLSRAVGSNGSRVLLLVKDSDATHSDPVIDQRGCYKRGDVVQVFAGDTPCQIPPAPPFWGLLVVGIPKGKAEKYEQMGYTDQVLDRRRLFGVVYDTLPTAVKTSLTTTRYAVVQWSSLHGAMRNKVSEAVEPLT
jgi:hypothetical protein